LLRTQQLGLYRLFAPYHLPSNAAASSSLRV
jgi:hypothetical protein